MVHKRIISLFTENNVIAIDKSRSLWYNTIMLNERKNNMTKAQAKLELFKTDRQIEKKIVEHSNELGQYNKSIVEGELQLLWDRKDILKKFINS